MLMGLSWAQTIPIIFFIYLTISEKKHPNHCVCEGSLPVGPLSILALVFTLVLEKISISDYSIIQLP